MMISELKEYIYSHNKIWDVLERLGCNNIKYNERKEIYSATQPDGDNPHGVNISNNQYLNYWSYTRGVSCDDCQDLIDLIQYNRQCSFLEAVKYLHGILGLEYSPYKKPEVKKVFDPLWMFKRAKEMAMGSGRSVNVNDIPVMNEEALNDFVPMLHIDWLRDGIMPWTREKFGLAYSYRRKRVIIPHRYWLTNQLLGMNMRTTIDNYEELGITKYILTKGMDKSINLYGLCENYDDIQEAGYAIVCEGERSVLKLHSRDGHENENWKYSFNGKTGVALSGKTMSDEQRRILIGLNVEIVIALDRDVSLNEVRCMCEKFYGIRKVSYMYDKYGILKGEKDSPADASNKVYDFLFRFRVPYGVEEHNEYVKSLKDKR